MLQTDRRTDGQTTYCGITALCVASRGKNTSNQRPICAASQKTLNFWRQLDKKTISCCWQIADRISLCSAIYLFIYLQFPTQVCFRCLSAVVFDALWLLPLGWEVWGLRVGVVGESCNSELITTRALPIHLFRHNIIAVWLSFSHDAQRHRQIGLRTDRQTDRHTTVVMPIAYRTTLKRYDPEKLAK